MSLSSREIDALEDIRVVMLARAQGAYGRSTMRIHANNLMQQASIAYGQGDLDQAIWLANREVQFNCRAFGFDHPYTKSSIKALSAIKRTSVWLNMLSMSSSASVPASVAKTVAALAVVA
jgi:hypothetical protein